MRLRSLSLLLLAGLAVGCQQTLPPRAADVDLAGEPALCPDFRAFHLRSSVEPWRDRKLEAERVPLGCPTARSLRLMVANPSDLDSGVTGPPRSTTAGAAVDRYTIDARKELPDLTTLSTD